MEWDHGESIGFMMGGRYMRYDSCNALISYRCEYICEYIQNTTKYNLCYNIVNIIPFVSTVSINIGN